MFPTRLRIAAATLALAAGFNPPSVHAQDVCCEPFCCDTTTQFFEPVDLDLDCQPRRGCDCGFFFGIDQVYWGVNGVKTTIGAPGLTYLSEHIFEGTRDPDEPLLNGVPIRDGVRPSQYIIRNGITDAPPHAEFAPGQRYELGYFQDGKGWEVSILDGPQFESHETYGFVDPNDPLSNTFSGFGSVHVNFILSTPDLLDGWRDYGTSQTIDGIGDNTGLVPLEAVVTGPSNTSPTAGLADGEVDNIDGDEIAGLAALFFDFDGDGELEEEELVGFIYDYDDLHTFNLRFEHLTVRNTTDVNNIEVMRTHMLSNRHQMAKHQNQTWSVGYGVRFFRLEDDFVFDGESDLIGRMYSRTNAQNQLVGPQVRVRWEHQQAQWTVALDTRFMAGWNIQDIDQTNGIGEEATPGALNKPAALQPTFSRYGRQDEDFAPLVEIRAQVAYQLTSAISLNVGYTGTFVESLTRASQVVEYRLPDMGISRGGAQDIYVNGVDFGAQVNY